MPPAATLVVCPTSLVLQWESEIRGQAVPNDLTRVMKASLKKN